MNLLINLILVLIQLRDPEQNINNRKGFFQKYLKRNKISILYIVLIILQITHQAN